MSKICPNCTSPLDEAVKFCPACGSEVPDVQNVGSDNGGFVANNSFEPMSQPVENNFMPVDQNVGFAQPVEAQPIPSYDQNMQQPMPASAQPAVVAPKKNKNVMYIAIGVVAAIIVGVVAFFLLSGGNSYTTPINKLCDGFSKKDASMIVSAYPPFMRTDVQSTADMAIGFMGMLGDYKVSCSIGKKEALSKSEIDEYVERYKQTYNVSPKISAGYHVTYKMKITAMEETNEDENTEVVLKIDGKWYLAD